MATAPFRNCLMVGRVGKSLQLGRLTQKPDNVLGTEIEGGQQGPFSPESGGSGFWEGSNTEVGLNKTTNLWIRSLPGKPGTE